MSLPVPPVAPIYKHTSHTFHLILTVCTFGCWALFVWWWWAIAQNASNNRKRKRYQKEWAEYEQALAMYEQSHNRRTRHHMP